MDEIVTVYVTKYALASGIIKARGVIRHNRFFADNPKRLYMLMLVDGFKLTEFVLTETEAQKVFEEKRLNMLMLVDGFTSTEFVLTEAEAQKVFEEKRLKVIKQAEKKLEKLKNLKMQIKEY